MRELITGQVLGTVPVVDLHAASFALDGRGVLLAGPKRAGKTSLLCHAIGSAGAALLANDRTFVQFEQTGPVVSGVPTVVSIRTGTAEAFPQLQLRNGEHPIQFHGGESGSDGTAFPDQPTASANLLLTPAQFARRLASTCVRKAALHAIVLPELSGGVDTWALERLRHDIGLDRVAACIYGSAARQEADTVFGSLSGRCAHGVSPRDLLARLVPEVPVYRCRIGPKLYREPAGPWLEALGLRDRGRDQSAGSGA